VKPVEKRDGSGSHNWGTQQDELEGQMEPAAEQEVVEGEAETAPVEATEAKDGETEAPAAPTEEEPLEYTLEEWKALQGERKKPEFNIRKPGEGEDNSQWKKTFVLDKKKDDEEEEEDRKSVV
jgi:plasminogen activator inhibitor 1 RNA-binding protein